MGFLGDLAGIAIRGVVAASLKLKKLPRRSQSRNPKTDGARPRLFLPPTMCAHAISRTANTTSR